MTHSRKAVISDLRAGLRSYKRLEEDFVKFRREVLDARDEVFEEKVLHV